MVMELEEWLDSSFLSGVMCTLTPMNNQCWCQIQTFLHYLYSFLYQKCIIIKDISIVALYLRAFLKDYLNFP